jgi:hypothetical protein
VLLRERPASPPHATSGGQNTGGRGGDAPQGDQRDEPQGSAPQDDNPFAAPPEGTPDQPWQPRHHPKGGGRDNSESPQSGSRSSGSRSSGSPEGNGSPWGSQWSDRQPGRSSGGFGERPGGGGPEGPGGKPGSQLRWDPTDPAQRRARYALLSGMWAFFFVIFGWPYVSLLLGALALYWGGSSLRAKPRTPDPDAPKPAPAGRPHRPQTTAAIGGMITGALALALVATVFAAQLVYRDYYTCVNDSLTSTAQQSCSQLLPQNLRGVLGVHN